MKAQTRTAKPSGFALVVTLSMMILLTVVAVGLLSLSSVSLRTSGQGSAMSMARANARLALMMAIGSLQRAAGPDTRVTARADILDDKNPPVLGVWKSWEGGDHEKSGQFAGRPKAPASGYKSEKEARFQGWLVSTRDISKAPDTGDLPETRAGADKIAILGEHSVGTADADTRQIHLEPILLTGKETAGSPKTTGGYAWWVTGENQKARLPQPYTPATENAATWSVLAKSHGIPDAKPFGLDPVYDDPAYKNPSLISAASKAITMKQGDLLKSTNPADKPISKEYYHDLSSNSVGLLTNTATGGWRKDLSLVADELGGASMALGSNLPFFRVLPEKDLMYARASDSNAVVAKSLLYPWSDYRRGAVSGNEAIYRFPPIGSWTNLSRYASIYKTLNATGAGSTMSTLIQAYPINGDVGSFIHNVRILPVVARIQWLFYHLATPASGTNAGKYDIKLCVQPVFTLWNPYNVTINDAGSITFSLNGSLPPAINYNIFGNGQPKRITLQEGWVDGKVSLTPTTLETTKAAFEKAVSYTIASTGAFGPGETRIFSPQASGNVLKAGYYPFTAGALNGNIATVATVPPPSGGNDKITTSMSFDTEYTDKSPGVGLYLDMNVGSKGHVLAYRMLYERKAAKLFYPDQPVANFPPVSLAQAAVPQAFLSVTFGARMASNTHLPSKGFVQSSPFVNYTAMGLKSLNEDTIQHQYPGTLNNVNSPFEFSFQGLSSGPNSYTPESDAKNHGFIVTGFRADSGLTRCIAAELPSRPLGSLAELQNWDARFENPVPPFSFNLVGNSDANPLFASDSVYNKEDEQKKKAENLQNDDSYCLNHMLFDDWFFSSIAPEPANFGKPAGNSTAKTVFTNLVNRSKTLPNRSYKLSPEGSGDTSPGGVSKLVDRYFSSGKAVTTYKTIASRLEVEGMFNVNSTSVKAWRALLGHARNQRVPYVNGAGGVALSSQTDYPVSRFSVAGDDETSRPGASGGGKGAEYTGYRVFSSAQLDFLADRIVEQVRLRGPFLSLSEFVNRQLSNDEDLAMAGAIQTALNQLAASGQSPYKILEINTAATNSSGIQPSNYATDKPLGPDPGYKFKKAAFGYSLYGLPGWTRQADVLRPIAPVLSARDDTFTIRAYGDFRDASGEIRARAYCEASVRRTRNYVDTNDDTEKVDLSSSGGAVVAKRPVNVTFGRRFEIISFRWMAPNEV